MSLAAPTAALPPAGDDALIKAPKGARQRMRQDSFYNRRLGTDGTIAPRARERGIQALRAAPVSPLQERTETFYSPLSGAVQSQKVTTSWSFAGPRPIKDDVFNAGAGIYGFGSASMKVNAIAVSSDGLTVFTGSFGGIAKSTDGGVNWRYVSDGLPSQSILSLAIDTSAPNIIYAGTGDPTFSGTGGTSLLAVGVYRSTDTGETWGLFGRSDMEGRVIYRVMVDPGTSGSQTNTTLYAAAYQGGNGVTGGVFRSDDSGQTWTEKHFGSAFDLGLDTTTSPATVYAAKRTNGLFKSTDRGENWTDLSAVGPDAPNNPGNNTKTSVSVVGPVIYYSNATSSGRVVKSVDSGATFNQQAAANGFCGGQCFYDQYVRVNPYDLNTVIYGGVDLSSSPDAGATYVNFGNFNPPNMLIHSDQHSAAFVNSTTIYAGNDGGIYKSSDSGRSWVNLNANLPGALFIGISASGDGTLYGGSQDNGGIGAAPGELDWHVLRGGDGGYNKIDPGNSQKIYDSYVTVGNVLNTLLKRSIDGGANHANITPAEAVAGPETALFYSPLFMDPEDSTKLLWGGQNLYRSADSGDNWTRLGDLKNTAGGSNIAAIAEAPSDANYVYVSREDNTLYVSENANNGNAAAWASRKSGVPAGQYLTAFAVHPASPTIAYLTLSGYGTVAAPLLHVFKTMDAGLNWVGISSGIPDVPALDIVLDSAAPSNLFVATDVGVFNSIDSGKTWARSDIGMPEGLIASALSFNSGTRKLTAGTYGRGAYTLTIPAAPAAPIGLAGAANGTSSITWTWSASAAPLNVQAYGLYYSSNPTVLIASVTSPSYAWTELLTNTSYSIEVTAANGALESANSTTSVAVTLASAPAAIAVAAGEVFASSATVAFSTASNPAGTLFEGQVSTDAFTSVLSSSFTRSAPIVFTGLTAGATQYFRVRAVNHAGLATAFTSVVSTVTAAGAGSGGALSAAAFSGLSTDTVRLNWTSSFPGGTTYYAQISTMPTFAPALSSDTLNTFADFSALSANTTFFAQVATAPAGPFTALGSSSTLAQTPITPVAYSQGTSSASIVWDQNGSPLGSRFEAQVSADDFGSILASSFTISSAAYFTGLTPDSTYYLRVRGLSHFGAATAFASTVSTLTYAAAPSSGSLTVGLSSMSITWGANGNPAGTTYQSAVSTDNFLTMNSMVSSAALSNTFLGLGPNTTYYLQARSLGRNGLPSASVSFTTLATYALAPVMSSVTVAVSSLVYSWSANGNPAGTSFFAEVSTDAFVTINESGFDANTSTELSGLLADTTYHFRLQAVSHGGFQTSSSSATPTATHAAAPAAAAPSALTAASFSSNWTANGNGASTRYSVQLSTDSFSTINVSASTVALTYGWSALSANTTYYSRVRADGHDGTNSAFTTLAATTTLLLPPAAAGASFAAVGYSSITAQWENGGNGAGTVYIAEVSISSAFAPVLTASSTLNLSVQFGSGGAGAALAVNTTHYFRVRTTNGLNSSLNVVLGSTVTSAFPAVGTTVLGVSSTTVSLDWQPNGNTEAITLYEVWRDVTGAFASPTKTVVSTSAATASGLSASATYFFKVRGLDNGGSYTTFDVAVQTGTLPPAPGAPGTPAGAALGVSSISWSWTAATFASVYRVYSASAPALPMASTATTSFVETGLATNTAYGLFTAGFNSSGLGALSAAATFYTLAAPPLDTAVGAVDATSGTVSWALNTNPAGSTAQVQRSTDNAVFASSLTLAATTLTDSGLLGCTTYYYRVRYRNGDGFFTAFDSTVSFVTKASTPSAPIGLSADSLAGNRIALSWTASPTEGVTSYRLYTDSGTGTIDYAAPLAVLTSTETSFTTGLFLSSGAYTFALRAKHRCLVEETTGVFASAASTGALAAVRAAIKTPDSGKRIKGNSVSVVAELTSGTPDQVSQVAFQFRAAGAGAWTNIPSANVNHPNPDLDAPYFIQWNVTGQAPGSYDLRAVAVNVIGSSDTAPAVTIITIVPGASSDYDINENLVGLNIVKDQIVNNAVANTITASGDGADDPSIKIVLPAGALTSSTVTVTVVANPAITTAAPSGFSLVGSALQIDLSNGQSNLNVPAALTLSYPETAGDPAGFQIQSLDPATGQWTAVGSPAIDSANRTVTAATGHFSLFAIINGGGGPPQADLSRVRVFPIPYKPNSGNPNEGKPYNAGDNTSGILFDRLPAAYSLKIYTLSGRLVAQFETTGAPTDTLQWDVKNADGRQAASGGYFAVIASPGHRSVVKRLAIIR